MDSVVLENKKYLSRNVNPILELLIAELLKNQPDDPVEFMKNWLRSEGVAVQNKMNLRTVNRPEGIESSSESDVDDDEELDEFVENQDHQKLVRKTDYKVQRISVSAEAYGNYNKQGDFKPPVHGKSAEAQKKLYAKLSNAFLFSHLADKEKSILVQAMQEKSVAAGDSVIKQGDDGDVLYVVEQGELDCYRKFTKEGKDEYLLTYKAGDAFGELALLYNAPRAASIVAKSACVLFALDRETFNHIVKGAVIQRRNKFEHFLSKIPILDSLNGYEKDKICDCLQTKTYTNGEYIIREGESGDVFYFIQSGNCKATKKNKNTHQEETVYNFAENDYFGELALLKNEPRAASIVTTSDIVEVAFIDRAAFKRLLGPLEEILKRNSARYEKYVLNKA